jgi:hypothetical protein
MSCLCIIEYMNKTFLLLLSISLVSCSVVKPPPVDVQLIPNDCANRQSITAWLERQINTGGHNEAEINSIKNRLWQIRYNCQHV